METQNLFELAIQYHNALPGRIREYLNSRGITDLLIDFHLLGWNGHRISIPILNRAGGITFFKFARDPEASIEEPKMVTTKGASAEIFGWDQVLRKPHQIIICEGEFDRLVLEGKGFSAVTSTGGAGTFKPEWAKEFESIPEVYICFDNDPAGQKGADRVGSMIPHAKIVELPEVVGPSGDVTDFFIRLGQPRSEFEDLLDQAMPVPPPPPKKSEEPSRSKEMDPVLRDRILAVKRTVPIETVISRYIVLNPSGKNFAGRCPFHEDKNPSFTVFPETGTFWCFGCTKHGDVITFMMEIEHLTFIQALKALEPPTPIHESGSQASQS